MARRVKVLHLIKGLGRGGAERLLVEMLPFVDHERYEHSFGYFLPWKDAFAADLRKAGAEVRCFGARTSAQCLMRAVSVARHLSDRKIDLVHCHMPIASVTGRLAGRMLGRPVISTEHNLLERYHPMTRRASLATWRMQRRVVAVSEEVRGSIERWAGTSVPVAVVRNGVPVQSFARDPERRRDLRQQLGFDEDDLVVGTVAVFRSQKRLDHWLEVAAAVTRDEPKARFLLVGDGPLRDDLEARATALGLGARLRFAGLQEDVRGYLSAMDVYMMSSEFEGLPVALLEAMAAELPPVVTAVGGIPEVVRDGTEGVVRPPGDPRALAGALRELLGDAGARAHYGRKARERVERDFGMARMVGDLERQYEAVL